MKVELLHIEDCPNWKAAGVVVREVLTQVGLAEVPVEYRLLKNEHELLATGFAGSPTVLIDGCDVIPGTAPIDELACRVYVGPSGLSPVPSQNQIRAAILSRMND